MAIPGSNTTFTIPGASAKLLIPRFKEEFGPLFYHRLHTTFDWMFNLDGAFTLFINLLDRSDPQNLKKSSLVYTGIERQRALIEEQFNHCDPGLSHHWNYLRDVLINVETGLTGGYLFREFQMGELGLGDIAIGRLSDYFSPVLEKEDAMSVLQRAEYHILEAYFDIEKDLFVSIPLIQFGTFEGVIHLIFKADFRSRISERTADLIRQSTIEYEGILLDWDLVGSNIEKKSMFRETLNQLKDPKYYSSASINPIFRELNYRKYYQQSTYYLESRLKYNQEIPARLMREHRKRAIIAILVDSYAHNISAHSLTALHWWFKQKAASISPEEIENGKASLPNEDWRNLEAIREMTSNSEDKAALEKKVSQLFSSIQNGLLDMTSSPDLQQKEIESFSLSRSLAPLFKFLLEKGAFWSGVTRDFQFGGEISNLFSVLWDDFIQNPLYLGTIAYTEGVTKLNVHLKVYERCIEEKSGAYLKTYEIKKSSEGQYLDSLLASIDASGFLDQRGGKETYLVQGELFKSFQTELENYQVFFPGGIVGKHSFFTILENEIRNVKHFSTEQLNIIQKEGLNLNLSILREHQMVRPEASKEASLYKIGVWLEHPTRLVEGNDHLVLKRQKGLAEDIISPETHQPRLGGSFQDKVCAAMLFNNSFVSVGKKVSNRDKAYYPWIQTGFSELGWKSKSEEKVFEVEGRSLSGTNKALKEYSTNATGYLKKFFHLWNGSFLQHVRHESDLDNENISRFRIVNLIRSSRSLYNKVRNAGVIRIINERRTDISDAEAYREWLRKWLDDKPYRVRFIQGRESELASIIFNPNQGAYFYSIYDYMDLDEQTLMEYAGYEEFILKFAHKGAIAESDNEMEGVLSIRSHGSFMSYYFPSLPKISSMLDTRLEGLKIYELAETLLTRICIFDNRVASRVIRSKQEFLHASLGCGIFSENVALWEAIKAEGFNNYHFLVLHLSFIENMKDEYGNRYVEGRIEDFISDQIIAHCPDHKLKDTFNLVITSGRGRTEWWSKLEVTNSPYLRFTTFRPVESLIEAVESAILIKDDINLKHYLVKVLFGS